MSRILVTGVNGFTGRYLAPELVAQGHEVHGLVHQLHGADEPLTRGVHQLHGCNLLDDASISRLIQELKPDKVVHLAAIAFVGHGDVDAIYRTNIVGTRNLLQALARASAAPTAVLLASSANVYGNATAGVIDESTTPAPANDYAVSKLAMEYMAATWQSQLPITVARPFNYTGVGQAENFLLPKIVAHFSKRAPVLELGNLDVERDFSDVRTLTQCYSRLLSTPCAGQVLNVCSGHGQSLTVILALAAEIAGYMPEIRVNPAFVRANEVHKLVGSCSRLEQVIGPIDAIPIKKTLAWMIAAATSPSANGAGSLK
ncbi:GDP-mannose 4,6-dehydratase [Roseateles albus]|uniref:GDP-mannose 4,6-dehydratase n=1 Tax=Roseateles albus TaxID=2987525 RepID=A0ABT5KFN5_9BURK|nr:GDP-mannose 4,6-dehydratase [Roseateles albus]MDC8772736.1 GDP-mannose 4,6-dehydratase [Roseateles albus]